MRNNYNLTILMFFLLMSSFLKKEKIKRKYKFTIEINNALLNLINGDHLICYKFDLEMQIETLHSSFLFSFFFLKIKVT